MLNRKSSNIVTALVLLVGAGSLSTVHANKYSDDDDDTTYTASWEAVADLPEKRSDMTASTVSDSIYIIGGCDQHQVACDWWDGCSYCPSISDTVLVYTPDSNSWTKLSEDMPRARYRHAAAVVDDLIYVIGGRDISDNLIEEVDVLNTATGNWATPSSANWEIPRSDEGAFYYSTTGKIYVGGGYNYSYAAYASVDILDTADDTWTYSHKTTTIADMAHARGDFSFVPLNGKYYAYGGWSHNDWCNPLNSTEVYDPSTNSWETLAPLLEGRGDKACGALNDRIFAIGGEHNEQCSAGSTPVSDVEVYDPDHPNAGWVVESYIPEEKFRFASATYDSYIYVFGGQSNLTYNCSDYDYCFPVTNHTWAFTETASSNNKHHKGPGPMVIVIIAVFFGFIAVVASLGCFFTKFGGEMGSSTSVPSEEPKDSDVEMTTSTDNAIVTTTAAAEAPAEV